MLTHDNPAFDHSDSTSVAAGGPVWASFPAFPRRAGASAPSEGPAILWTARPRLPGSPAPGRGIRKQNRRAKGTSQDSPQVLVKRMAWGALIEIQMEYRVTS